jgi:hypothetical protein
MLTKERVKDRWSDSVDSCEPVGIGKISLFTLYIHHPDFDEGSILLADSLQKQEDAGAGANGSAAGIRCQETVMP